MTDATEHRAAELLAPGTRIRSRQRPDIEGKIEGYEYQGSGEVSAIPYRIRWDSDAKASEALGWFFLYASDATVEAIP